MKEVSGVDEDLGHGGGLRGCSGQGLPEHLWEQEAGVFLCKVWLFPWGSWLLTPRLWIGGWEGARASCGLTLLWCGGDSTPQGVGLEQGVAPQVMPMWKLPANVVSSLCLTWDWSIATAGDLGRSEVLHSK